MTASSLTFTVTADDFEPNEITHLLGLSPYQAWKKGESKLLASGKTHTYPSACWKLLQDEATRQLSVEDQFEYWVELLSSRGQQLKELRRLGYSVELNCFIVSNSEFSFILMPETLTLLGTLGIQLLVECICDDETNE